MKKQGTDDYLLTNNDISIKDGTDVNSIMRDMMSVLLEGALDEELDEELGYSKYDEYSCGSGSSSIIRFYSWNYTATIV